MPKLTVFAIVAVLAATLTAGAPATRIRGYTPATLTILPANTNGSVGAHTTFSAWAPAGGKKVNVTSSTRFSITNGSCSGAVCSSTRAGSHTVRALYDSHNGPIAFSILTGSTSLTLAAGALASLVVSPHSATVEPPLPLYSHMNVSDAAPYPATQTFSAEGYDAYGNDLGNETESAQWTSDANCDFNVCRAFGTDSVGVTAAIGSATDTATLTGAYNSLFYSCSGEHYDVDGALGNGCEKTQNLVAHTQGAASDLGSISCADSPTTTMSGTLYSDQRAHTSPSVTAFDSTVGSAPEFWSATATGGACTNDYSVQITTTGGGDTACYKLTLTTDQVTASITVNGNQTASTADTAAARYTDGTPVYFELEKVCSQTVHEAVGYTITFHL